MKILVTGASGFVGSRTCAHLAAGGHQVIRVSRTSDSGLPNEYAFDITEPAEFERIKEVREIDAAVHCAGIAHRFGRTSKGEFWRVNVEGAKNVARFAARNGIGRFIHLSSVLVYGMPTSNLPVREGQELDPKDDYAASKLAGETAVTEVCESEGIKLTILRPVPVIGEGSRGNVSRLIRAIHRKRFVWIGDGRNERSFVYVNDVARAIEAGLSLTGENAILNVTGGQITVREMVEIIAESLSADHPRSLMPHWLANAALQILCPLSSGPKIERYYRALETWLADAVYSGEALVNLGFRPVTGIREGLKREVESFLASK